MKRRSFFAMMLGFIAAPFAPKAERSDLVNAFIPYQQDVLIFGSNHELFSYLAGDLDKLGGLHAQPHRTSH